MTTNLLYIGKSKSFLTQFGKLPYTDCADYLFVDRSAMMRELGRMKEEGLIRTEGKKIWLEEKKLR